MQLERRFNGGGASGTGPAAPAFSLHRLRQAAVSQLQATLMPAGYPDSVAPGYLQSTLWQAAHHCAGSANGGAAARGTAALSLLSGSPGSSASLPFHTRLDPSAIP